MDDHGHGTHVSGTIAARGVNDGPISSKGIAPEVKIALYKALDSNNSFRLNNYLKALEDCVNDGCRIVSMSIGFSSANGATHASTIALNSLALQNEDVLFVLCAGNNGSNSYTIWSPGTSPMALTVGNALIPAYQRLVTLKKDGQEEVAKLRYIRGEISQNAIKNGDKYTIESLKADGSGNYTLVYLPTVDGTGLGTGTQAEFDAFFEGKTASDYDGVLFVVARGQAFDDVVARIQSKCKDGALAVANTLSNENSFENIFWWQGYFDNYLPVFTMNYKESLPLLKDAVYGEKCSFTLTNVEDLKTVGAASGVEPNVTSSRGPVVDTYELKPDISAPGTAVFSTVFKDYNGQSDNYDNAYAVMTGTSMATPHISAFAALLLQKNPELTVLQLKSLLVNTADTTCFGDEISLYASGAGLVNPQATLDAVDNGVYMTAPNSNVYTGADVKTTTNTPTISMDAAEAGKESSQTVTVTLTNISDEDRTYSATLKETSFFAEDGGNASDVTFKLDGLVVASEAITAGAITVKANSTATFTLTANVSAQAKAGSYETMIVLTSGDDQLVSPVALYVYEYKPYDPVDTDYTFLHTNVLSSGEYKQLADYSGYGSDRTYFQFRFKENVNSWQPLLYNTDGKLVGMIDGYYQNDWQKWDWYYYDVMGSWYCPCTLSDDGVITKTGDYGPIPEGTYKIKLLLKGGTASRQKENVIVEISDLVIDNTLPQISLIENTSWGGNQSGNSIIYKGTIYDEMTAQMEKAGINFFVNERVFGKKTSQQDNVVVVKVDNEYYRADIAADGTFTVTLPASCNGKVATVYYGDHFLPNGSESKLNIFNDGFDVKNLSYAVNTSSSTVPFMKWFAYRATNMTSFDVKLDIAHPTYPTDTPEPTEPSEDEVVVETTKAEDNSYDVVVKVNGKEDEAEKEQLVTIDVENVSENACAYEVLEDGTLKPIKMSIVKNGTLYFRTDKSVKIVIKEPTKVFNDIEEHWGKGSMLFVSSHNIMNGETDTQFAPDDELSRGMLATILYRLADATSNSQTQHFTDVNSDKYYADGINWAYENKIVNGLSETEFAPENDITRQEIAVMLYKFAKSMGYNTDNGDKAQMSSFSDYTQSADWAKEALEWTVSNGIITGQGNNMLNPTANTTRAEAATMIQRFIDQIIMQ